MTHCRVKFVRGSPASGSFDWVLMDDTGSKVDSGVAPDRLPPGPTCELVVASELVLLDAIPAPAPQQRRFASALRFLVEDAVSEDPERVHVASGDISATRMLPVAIIDRQWLKQALARLTEAGLAPRRAFPECLLADTSPGTWTIVVDGASGFVRSGNTDGFALDFDDPAEPPASLGLVLEKARRAQTVPDRLILRAAPGSACPAAAHWAEKLGVPVVAGDPWLWTEARNRAPIDLLQGEFATTAVRDGWWRGLRRTSMLAAALAIVSVMGASLDWANKAHERDALRAEMERVYRRTFGENATIADAPLQMMRGLDQLRRQSGQLTAGDFVPLFSRVAGRLLDPARHQLERITYADGVLTLTIRPLHTAQFGSVINDMRAAMNVPSLEVQLEPSETTERITVRATVAPVGKR